MKIHTTARDYIVNLIAHRLARHDGYQLERMMAAERLSYETLADEIVGLVGHKMAAQNKELSELLQKYWDLPA